MFLYFLKVFLLQRSSCSLSQLSSHSVSTQSTLLLQIFILNDFVLSSGTLFCSLSLLLATFPTFPIWNSHLIYVELGD